jgi:glycosyltransferase involved in cell wall biosynthesis
VLAAIGHDFIDAGMAAHGKRLRGSPQVGVAFLEAASLSATARERARDFALIIAGCTWNERILRANGIAGVTTVLQGVDTGLFHPAPRAGLLGPDRFVVFSGGKLELRKGQDLVLAAFRAFHRRHPEAMLLTAWFSPWSDLMASAVGHPGVLPPRPTSSGAPDIVGWAAANGIPPEAVIAIGPTPNIAMPHVVREADVALFPNRAEGGTNLVAMECLACGIPSILSANTGHLDLLRTPGIAIALTRQGKVTRAGTDTTDWGESDVEEAVEALETVWRDRQAARAMGERAARFMAGMDWRRQTALLLRAIDPLLP